MIMKRRTLFLATPRLLVVGLFVFSTACHHRHPSIAPRPVPRSAPPPARTIAAIRSAPTLVAAMHDRYAGDWYHTVAFTQKTTLGLPSGGEIVQTWHESARLPGHLRIDTDLSSKAGVLFARDSIFNFNDGKLTRADTGANELLVLGFDVYTQSPAKTEAVLRGLGFDLSKFHEGSWDGTQVYVVGAMRGDTVSKQFWIDKNRLLFVRMLENAPQGHTDVRFSDYERAGGGWIATDVTQLVNGKRRIHEQYSNVRTNITLPDALFDPKHWAVEAHGKP
jgi:hypothetical protein